MRRVIITGDDFGLALPVNEAITEAHSRGILTTASLIVGAAAAPDAIRRAQTIPTLRVGLHLVVVEGRPVLPADEVPDLVDSHGEFSTQLVRAGFRFFFQKGVLRQLEAEIRAQFGAFCRTGLCLDHVNAHNHMHIHPGVLNLILNVGRDYGMSALRVPFEPPVLCWRATRDGLAGKLAAAAFLAPWLCLMKSRIRRAGLHANDYVFGMTHSGRMTRRRVLAFLKRIPEGVTEMYFHPAARKCAEVLRHMPDYRHEEEFAALIDPVVAGTIAEAGIEPISFSDLSAGKGASGATFRPAGIRGASGPCP